MPVRYQSGEVIVKGDRVLFPGELGEIDSSVPITLRRKEVSNHIARPKIRNYMLASFAMESPP
jgi:hypothetical protein